MCCWFQLANFCWEFFHLYVFSNIVLWLLFLAVSLSSFSIRVILTYKFRSIHSLFIFLKKFKKIGISSLNLGRIYQLKQANPEVFIKMQ